MLDQLCRTPQLVRKTKLKRNDSQSDLKDYTSSTSSSIKITKQITNQSHGGITCIQHTVRSKIPTAGKVQRLDSYPDSIETSGVQSQNKIYSENGQNQYLAYVLRNFYGWVTHSMQNRLMYF